MQIKTIERCLRRLQIAEQNRTEQKTCRFTRTQIATAHTQEPSSHLGARQDGPVLLTLSSWGFGQRESPSICLWRALWRQGILYSTGQECYYLYNWWNAASGSFLCLSLPPYFMIWQFGCILHCIFLSFIVLFLPSQRDCDCWLFCCYILKQTGGSISWICYLVSW